MRRRHRFTALVTGAAAGLGRAIATELVLRGGAVVCIDIDGARLTDALAELSDIGTAWPVKADLRDRDECRSAVDEALDLAGELHVVVNNAAVARHESPQAISIESVRDVFAVNFFAPVMISTIVLPAMIDNHRGSIINVASVAGHIPTPFEATYGASKAALWRWSHNLDMELRGSGVRVSTLSPGPMDTDIWDKDGSRDSYGGKLYPPQLVAKAAARLITHPKTQRTVPGHFALPSVVYSLATRPTRWALRQFSARHPHPN